MKKKNIILFSLIFFISILVLFSLNKFFISDVNIKNLLATDEKVEVTPKEPKELKADIINIEKFSYPKKEWHVIFNADVDEESINNGNIYIEDSKENKVSIKIKYDDNLNIVKIKPKNFYKTWEKYKLVLETDIMSVSKEKHLSKKIEYEFDISEIVYLSQTNNNYEEYRKVNNEYKGIGPEIFVENDEQFYNEVKLALENYDEELVLKLNNSDNNDFDIKKIVDYLAINLPLLNNYVENREYKYLVEEEILEEENNISTVKYKFDYRLGENSIEKEKIKKMDKEVRQKVKVIVDEIIKPEMNNWQKEKVIYDYIINNCEYNEDYLETYNSVQNSDYGVLINKKALCGGYAKAFYSLMNEAGLDCIYVEGRIKKKYLNNPNSSTLHAWNIVNFEDEFYQVDSTWGASKIFNKIIPTYRYFNINDDKLSKSHSWDNYYYPECNGEKYLMENLNVYENKIPDVNNYNDFYEIIKNAIRNKEDEIYIRVNKYYKDTYSIEKTIDKMGNEGVIGYSFEYMSNENYLINGYDEIMEIYIREI
ncbi:MAG: transglutaminase domain-containing protein [Clostridiales bacterium]